jgi:hypothetical protein
VCALQAARCLQRQRRGAFSPIRYARMWSHARVFTFPPLSRSPLLAATRIRMRSALLQWARVPSRLSGFRLESSSLTAVSSQGDPRMARQEATTSRPGRHTALPSTPGPLHRIPRQQRRVRPAPHLHRVAVYFPLHLCIRLSAYGNLQSVLLNGGETMSRHTCYTKSKCIRMNSIIYTDYRSRTACSYSRPAQMARCRHAQQSLRCQQKTDDPLASSAMQQPLSLAATLLLAVLQEAFRCRQKVTQRLAGVPVASLHRLPSGARPLFRR